MAVVGIARHALHHLRVARRVVLRFRDALQGMAAHAAVEKLLLLGRSGKARDPFGVGHLGRDVPDLAQLQVDRDGEGEGDLHRARAVELVSGCPDLQRIRAGSELRRRKGETAAVVADDADRDRRTGLFRADDHALHRAFFRGAHAPGQSGRGLGRGRCRAASHKGQRQNGSCKQLSFHGRLPCGFPPTSPAF